jgi:co-chaperonin GroES (HSP10)
MILLKDRILVKMNPSEVANASGIILPVSMQEKNIGIVVKIGVDVKAIKVGDKVKKYNDVSGPEIEYEGERVLILSERESIELIL